MAKLVGMAVGKHLRYDVGYYSRIINSFKSSVCFFFRWLLCEFDDNLQEMVKKKCFLLEKSYKGSLKIFDFSDL